MSLLKDAWRGVCKTVQGGAHYGARVATVGVQFGGKVSKCACKAASSALNHFGCERIAETIDNVGDTVDHGAQAVSDAATAAVDIVVGTPMAAISLAVGDDDMAEELGDNIRETIDSLGDNCEATKEHATAAKDHLVGKAQFDSAHNEYMNLLRENTLTVAEIREARGELNEKINRVLEAINSHKRASKLLFVRFAVTSRKIAQWMVAHYETPDVFICEPVDDVPLKTPSEIFVDIDFDNDPIWSHIKGVFTAGLLTVSQVEDARVKIHGCRRAAEATWRQDHEINKKYGKLLDSLEFVNEAFGLFVPLYARLQDELEYALSSIGQIMAQRDMYYFADSDVKVNPYFLSKHQLNVLMACEKLTRILCDMTKRHYMALVDDVPVAIEDDRNKVEWVKRNDYQEIKEMLAA